MEKRRAELTALFKRLYEDNVLGRISDAQYQMLSQEYAQEQEEINKRMIMVASRIKELNEAATNISRFLDKARKYTDITELTSEILWTFIQRVEVSERLEKRKQNTPQEIRIYYRDIGLLDDMPVTVPSARSTG